MAIPLGRRYTAKLSASRPKFVTCEKCQYEFVYFMKRSASGTGTSFLFLDNAGAKLRAHDEANATLYKQLNQEQDAVPCPECGWVQLVMIPFARREYRAWMAVVGVVALFAMLVFAFLDFVNDDWWYLNPSSPAFFWVVALLPLGAGLIALRHMLAQRYDPNAVDVTIRRQTGAKRALSRLQYDALVAAALPKAEKHWPIVASTKIVREHRLGAFRARLEDDIVANRGINYRYLLRVYSIPDDDLHLCITAECSEFVMPGVSEQGAYFLRLYTGFDRVTLDNSPDWADRLKFEQRALHVVREQLAGLEPTSSN